MFSLLNLYFYIILNVVIWVEEFFNFCGRLYQSSRDFIVKYIIQSSGSVNPETPYLREYPVFVNPLGHWYRQSSICQFLVNMSFSFIHNLRKRSNPSFPNKRATEPIPIPCEIDEDDTTYAFKPFKFHELSPSPSDSNPSTAADLSCDQEAVVPPNEPRPRSGHRIICDENNFYSFGGYLEVNQPVAFEFNIPGTQHLFDELWKFNLSTQTWEMLQTHGETPKELASHSAVRHGDYMVTYGGTGVPFGSSSSNKFSVCDLRTFKFQKLNTAGQSPLPQYGQAIVLDGQNFYVIGGTSGYDYSLDVHKLDLTTFEWEPLFVTRGDAREPTPRYRHEVAFLNEKIYIFGGGTATKAFDLINVPTFDVKTREWTNSETIADPQSKNYPAARKCQGLVQRGEDVFICGGYNSKCIFTDLWKLNLITLQWTKMPIRIPLPVYFHSTALTPSGCMLMFGGVTNVKLNQRTNRVFKIWLTVPSLKEISWESILHYFPHLKNKSQRDILEAGIPGEFVARLLSPARRPALVAPPL